MSVLTARKRFSKIGRVLFKTPYKYVSDFGTFYVTEWVGLLVLHNRIVLETYYEISNREHDKKFKYVCRYFPVDFFLLHNQGQIKI